MSVPEALTVEKRLRLIAAFILIFGLLLGLRLFQKQVLEHQSYLTLAKNQQITRIELAPQRGKIFDSRGNILASSIIKYQIMVVPKNVEDYRKVADSLAPLIELPAEEIYQKINNKKAYLPALKTKVEEPVAKKIADLGLEGVVVVPEELRFYPEDSLAAHILGFVNAEGDGKYGLEGYYNEQMKGFSGSIIAEKDTRGRFINIGGKTASRNGADFYLTVDRNVQKVAEEKLAEAVEKFKADSGQVLIMESKTGKILAMAGYPSFNPNEFNKVDSKDQWIFNNPVIANSWEPGSVFKPLAMAAAIDKAVVEPETQGVFSNKVVVQGREIHTADDKAYGRETMTQILENSDNVGMVWVTEQLGKEALRQYLEKFGFGEKTGISLDKEVEGSLISLRSMGEINRATMSFGQGIAVTPIQLITALNTIANGGKMMTPFIVEKKIEPSGKVEEITPKEKGQIISPETAAKLTNMLVSVVKKGHGKKAQVPGYLVAGKTGTAQIPKTNSSGYEEGVHIGSFAGFAPADNPAFVMLVKLDRPKTVEFAESSAAPTFAEIAQWLLSNYFKIPPS